MTPVAPRQLFRLWRRLARGALVSWRLWLAVLVASVGPITAAAEIVAARYADPTERYPHGILGDEIEYQSLLIDVKRGLKTRVYRVRLPLDRVFEDTEPRLADLDGDGNVEVVVVETHMQRGAQLAIYDETGKVASTPYIGMRFRWLAPVGIADLDGDGKIEIAYIDRPHLAKTLRIWTFDRGVLVHVVDQAGLTNHRIGERDIAGGIRDCGDGPEIVTANADWSQIVATRWDGQRLFSRQIGVHRGRASFRAAMSC